MTKYLLTLSIGFVGAVHEEEVSTEEFGYTQEQWDSVAKDRKTEILLEEAEEYLGNKIEYGFKELND